MTQEFFIVTLGGSSGSIPSLCTFFDHLPADTGAAFVVILHLDRKFRSSLDAILALHTEMPILRITRPTAPKPDHVYLLVEDQMLGMEGGSIVTRPRRADEVLNNAIDLFLPAVAAAFRTRTIAIILPGMGRDGTNGALAVHRRGGMVLIQDPDTTAFKSMPLHVQAEDHPVASLSPEHLARNISHYLHAKKKLV